MTGVRRGPPAGVTAAEPATVRQPRGWWSLVVVPFLVLFAVGTPIEPRFAYVSVPASVVLTATLWASPGTVARRLRDVAVVVSGVCVAVGIGGLVAASTSDPGDPPPDTTPPKEVLGVVEDAIDVMYRRPDAGAIDAHLPTEVQDRDAVVPCLVDAGGTEVDVEVIGVRPLTTGVDRPAIASLSLRLEGDVKTIQLRLLPDGGWSIEQAWDVLQSRGCS